MCIGGGVKAEGRGVCIEGGVRECAKHKHTT